ncbi:PhoPQ-activated protein PqaA family protein [Candidatus Poribacteria bacterium]
MKRIVLAVSLLLLFHSIVSADIFQYVAKEDTSYKWEKMAQSEIPMGATKIDLKLTSQTWQAEKVSIWQAGTHDNPFGMRLTTLMIGKRIADSSVPMSLLADHPNVQFNFYRQGVGTCEVEMH